MPTTWKERAKAAVEAGWRKNNGWHRMLKRHMAKLFPERVQELGKEFDDYCAAMAASALERMDALIDSGTDPFVARELALDQLLPKPPDEEDRAEPRQEQDADEEPEVPERDDDTDEDADAASRLTSSS